MANNDDEDFSVNDIASSEESSGASQGQDVAEPQVTAMLLSILYRQEEIQRKQILEQLMHQPPKGELKEGGKENSLRAFLRLHPPTTYFCWHC
jgi:hypothetical protein